MIDIAYFTALILVFLRLISFFTVATGLFPKGTPPMAKIGVAIILSYIILPGVDLSKINSASNMMIFMGNGISEIITGIILGFAVELCFMAAKFAGSMMDIQSGLSMASMFDPNSNSNATLIERLLYWISLVMFFIVDGHHILLLQLIESFKWVTLGKLILFQGSAGIIIEAFISFFIIGFKMAIPIILIVIITDLVLGLMSRTVPQLNVMILGLPIKILMVLASFLFAMPIFLNLIGEAFSLMTEVFKGIFNTLPMIPVLFIFASDDKTEEATPHKLNEAKKKGQVAKSKEASLALTLLACTLIITALGNYIVEGLKDTIIHFLTNFLYMELSYNNLFYITFITLTRVAMLVLPVMIPIMIMGIAANLMQTGIMFTKEPIKPDFKKLNPISGIKRMFSVRTLVELVKDVLLITVVGYIGYKFIMENYTKILNLYNLRFSVLIEAIKELIQSIFFKVTLVLVALALGDYIFQRRQFKKDMRMTKQEIKEEFKQQEGDPQVKGKIKQKQREMAMSRMMQSIPDASVIVTNPTHLAIALRYKQGKDEAPKVIGKGADYIALKIKEKAREYEIPIIENKPLARMIYEKVEIDEEIPVEMYQAVAEILAVIMKSK
ncbi:fused FliR family export protein/FlhB family type III secretion system protein [Clostridium sp. HMP27]|uniref:fused FliR family export protein/FlhB family type III secretion system protein n=1 Tax=Clostridium sp. HMP27 TaxID=1487921 RepID=UPI00052E1A77|nr:fused FliR family export protein/FlhB family type III secretion system protein [Clostridium sp. HMP27]KGK86112.1 flagellar biosynthesis protein FlhB [Clostridium sp. HMP27]